MNAFALNALAGNATRLVIPAIGGLLIVWIGPGPTMLYGVALYIVATVTVMGIQLPRAEDARGRAADGIQKLVEAFRYVTSEPPLLIVLGLSALQIFVLMPFVHSLLPVYAAEEFDMGPAGLGMLMSALGAGAAVGTISLATVGDVARKGRLLIVTMAIGLIAMIALSQSGGALHPVPVMLLLGGATAAQFSIGGAIVIGRTPQALRGRVSALTMMVVGLFPMGALIAGGLAEALDAPTATLIGAGATVLALAALGRHLTRLWQLGEAD